jgi:uncharacterized protein with PIN domain
MPITFAAEKTLGRLGKWLRMMGFDTLSETEYPRGTFKRCIGPDRIYLTRTRKLIDVPVGLRTIFIQANHPAEQLVELVRKAAIRREDIRPFSRCILCNEPIVAIARHAVRESIPDFVWNTQANFSSCPKCGRVYWRGSHTERAWKQLMGLFNEI